MKLDAETIIVGAGFAGLGLAIQLKKSGDDSFLVLERAGDVGGTWRDNVYPGCACDIPAVLYSFSFEPDGNWTRTYPQQPELLRYLRRTAEKYGLLRHIRFNGELAEARFNESDGVWEIGLSDGTTLRSRVLVSAIGALSKPFVPHIPGVERFAGASFHSAAWDHSLDLKGKHVAVVGTGASAIQFVPEIAPQVSGLTIFQRTPPWIIPRNDKRVGPLGRILQQIARPYVWLARQLIYWTLELRAIGFVINPKLLQLREKLVLRFIERSIADPELRAKVTPQYRAGCKRILISDDYYPAIQRPNVNLVASPLAEIRERSVVAADGSEHAADVIIYGTGFNATGGIAPLRIYGRDGVELGEIWRDGMSAYLGTSIAGFPNLFFLIGPNTGLGHNSMILMMEAQYRFITSALRYMRANRLRAIDVKPEVQSRFNEALQQRLAGTVWATGCSSWYLDARGENTALWPGFTFAFRAATRRFDPGSYRLEPA